VSLPLDRLTWLPVTSFNVTGFAGMAFSESDACLDKVLQMIAEDVAGVDG
jgi:hypothetical protein